MTDWGQLYRDNAAAVTALATDLSAEQRSLWVPGTPEWTVHDLIAHLSGGAADAVTGRMDGAPGPTWTSRHVAERSPRAVTDLTAELAANQDAVAALVAGVERPALVWDIAVHHADLHETLRLGAPPERYWRPVLDAVAPRMLAEVPATVRVGPDSWGAGGATVEVAPYELFRSLFSRRSRAQMQAWGAPALSADQLEQICLFGARDDEQPVPA